MTKGVRPRRAASLLMLLSIMMLGMVAPWRGNAARALSYQGNVMLVGSSSINGAFGHVLARDIGQLGFRVTRKGFTSAGIARPDFRDVRELVRQERLRARPSVVLLYFGGNDAQSIWLRPEERPGMGKDHAWIYWSDKRWSSIYEARAKELVGDLCARNTKHVAVIAPADVKRARLQERLVRIRASLRRAAESTTCGHYISTTGDSARFGLGAPLRTPDGVHMTRLGALRVWNRVRDRVLSVLHVASPPSCLDCGGIVAPRSVGRPDGLGSVPVKRDPRAAARGT